MSTPTKKLAPIPANASDHESAPRIRNGIAHLGIDFDDPEWYYTWIDMTKDSAGDFGIHDNLFFDPEEAGGFGATVVVDGKRRVLVKYPRRLHDAHTAKAEQTSRDRLARKKGVTSDGISDEISYRRPMSPSQVLALSDELQAESNG